MTDIGDDRTVPPRASGGRDDAGAVKKRYERLCADNSNDPEAWFLLSKAHLDLGLPAEAETCARKGLAFVPESPKLHRLLAMALQQQGRLGEAEQSYRTALRLNAQQPVVWLNLGIVLQESGHLDDAEAAYREALHIKPDYTRAHANLGRILQLQDRMDEAADSFRAALAYEPDNPELLCNLGIALSMLGKHDEAIRGLQNAVRLRPAWAEAWCALGNAWLAKGETSDRREAVRYYREAQRLQPESPEIAIDLGNILRDLQRYDEAEEQFRRVLALQPEHPHALVGLASLLEFKGEAEKGYELLRPAIEAAPDDIHVALAFAGVARRADRSTEAIAMLERCLPGCANDPKLCAEAHLALGKLYDKARDYQQAFTHYDAAKKLDKERLRVHFDAENNRMQFALLTTEFCAETLACRPRATNRSRLPVFIVGMPRSGTSLVEQILASHPRVHGAGELEDISLIYKDLPRLLETDLPFPRCMALLKRKTLDQIAQRYLNRLARLGGSAMRVTDKMPHNFLLLGLIDQLFPGARVIHVHRDPMDTCLSIYFQRFNEKHPYAFALEDLGRYYRQYEGLMAHWRAVLRLPLLDVRYEELVSDPEAVVRRLLAFCELEWDDRCLRFHESKRLVSTPSYDQVRQPLYRSSVERWRRYEPWLGELKAALGK